MKKPLSIFRNIFELAPIGVLLTGCQTIDSTFGPLGYVAIGLFASVVITIIVVNFTPSKIVIRKFRSLF